MFASYDYPLKSSTIVLVIFLNAPFGRTDMKIEYYKDNWQFLCKNNINNIVL